MNSANAKGLIHYWLNALAIVSLVNLPTVSPAYDGQGFTPRIIVIVDESGSMEGRQSWLEAALLALDQALDERNRNVFPDDIEYTLAGFTEHSRELAQQSSAAEASGAVRYLDTKGGIEDGYVAIHDVLNRHPEFDEVPTTVIMITDEDRDVTDPYISLGSLSQFLAMKDVMLHVVTRARIECTNLGAAAIAIDKNRVALKPGPGGLSICENARVHTFG